MRVKFTAGRIAAFRCAPNKSQAFIWDTEVPGLGVKASPGGSKKYILESRLKSGRNIRLTIGDPKSWSIDAAQVEARSLQTLIDQGIDPRQAKADAAAIKQAAKVAASTAAIRESITLGDVWPLYMAERRDKWGERHYKDHIEKAKGGGEPAKRGTRGRGVTTAGPLHPLMALKLRELDAVTVEAWAAKEAKTRPTAARLAWRLLKVFLGWCSEQPEYAHVLPAANPAKTKKSREAFGKARTKSDVLQREQLAVWLDAVRRISNPVMAAYLQTLLFTGARPGEVLVLRWEDVNSKWKGLTIRDKVEGERVIPLTPYVSSLLTTLPRRNGWVFSGVKEAHISSPNHQLASASKVAGIEGLTLHGLRRSFKSLTEWLEIPAGVVAQIMGHKPSATAEKHYTVRPLDLLRVHHEKIEAWILEQAGIDFVPAAPGLRVVTAA